MKRQIQKDLHPCFNLQVPQTQKTEVLCLHRHKLVENLRISASGFVFACSFVVCSLSEMVPAIVSSLAHSEERIIARMLFASFALYDPHLTFRPPLRIFPVLQKPVLDHRLPRFFIRSALIVCQVVKTLLFRGCDIDLFMLQT